MAVSARKGKVIPYTLHTADCIEWMEAQTKLFPNGCFDLIFADPPYRLSNGGITCVSGKMVSVNKGDWDKSAGFVADYAFTKRWLALCQQLLTPNGTIWVSGTSHVIFKVGTAMAELEYRILNDIVWEKPNPPPNLGCRCFTHSHEILLWASKNRKSKHQFDYQKMKQTNGGKQMKSVWRMPSTGKGEKTHGKHPTQKPILLLERILAAAAQKGATVFDPFMGSGTTAIAALRHGCQFVGCEISPEYVQLAEKRINAESEPRKA